MTPPLSVLLIGSSDEFLYSMKLFPEMILRGLTERGIAAQLIRPRTVFGKLAPYAGPLGKWLFYVDKYFLFPFHLRRAVRRRRGPGLVAHVCDHSNAMYTAHLQAVPHLVTCHDFIAVKSARGETPQYRTRWSGQRLQRWIVAGLNRARLVACISQATQSDVRRISTLPPERVRAVHMGQNLPYTPMAPEDARARVAALTGRTEPYLFHVSSNSWYKNRLGLLHIHAAVCRLWPAEAGTPPRLLLAGERNSAEMDAFIAGHPGLVTNVGRTSHEDLRALYSAAALFVFPSWDEGFGWPVIEAQGCGCPVAVSDIPTLTEVSGSSVVRHDPADAEGFARKIIAFLREGDRAQAIAEGFRNEARFTPERMIEGYLALYRELLQEEAG